MGEPGGLLSLGSQSRTRLKRLSSSIPSIKEGQKQRSPHLSILKMEAACLLEDPRDFRISVSTLPSAASNLWGIASGFLLFSVLSNHR